MSGVGDYIIEDITGAMIAKLIMSGCGDYRSLLQTPINVIVNLLQWQNFTRQYEQQQMNDGTNIS